MQPTKGDAGTRDEHTSMMLQHGHSTNSLPCVTLSALERNTAVVLLPHLESEHGAGSLGQHLLLPCDVLDVVPTSVCSYR